MTRVTTSNADCWAKRMTRATVSGADYWAMMMTTATKAKKKATKNVGDFCNVGPDMTEPHNLLAWKVL